MNKNKFFNIIKQGFLSLVGDDSEAYPTGRVKIQKNEFQYIRLSDYGLCSNPPKDSHVLLLNSQGQESIKFGIVNDFLRRKKDLKEGETALFNTLTGSTILLKEDGTIEILTENNLEIGCKEFLVDATDKASLEATKIAIGDGTNELLDLVDQTLAQIKKLVGATLLQGNVDAAGAASTGTNSLILGGLTTMETDIDAIIAALGVIKE